MITVISSLVAGIAVQSESGGPLVVSATDKDTGTNALIGYRMLTDDQYFTVRIKVGWRREYGIDYRLIFCLGPFEPVDHSIMRN